MLAVRQMRPLNEGIARTGVFRPSNGDTAAAVGNAGVDAVATVTLILWTEGVCGELVHHCLEDGEATVGVRVAVDHTGPARVGRPVSIEARVESVSGRTITFGVRALQDGREVMTGEHRRVVVSLDRFLEGTAREQTVEKGECVSFWFDVISPWSYIASTRIGGLARRHGIAVDWRPLHLGNLMKAVDGMRPMEQSPARVAWYLQDVADRMAEAGLAYHPHPAQPLRPSRALRCIAYAVDEGCADAFVQTVMRGYWGEGADIADPAVLQEMAGATGMGPRPMADIASDAHYKQVIETNTRQAVEAGLFGVPGFVFRDKLYFGCDHMDMVERAMALQEPVGSGVTRPACSP